MASSGRPRKIVINGVEFQWKADIRGYHVGRFVHVRMWQMRAGSTLIANLVGVNDSVIYAVDTSYPTPKDVRQIIEYGIQKGWKYAERGKDLLLTSADEIYFDDLILIDAATP